MFRPLIAAIIDRLVLLLFKTEDRRQGPRLLVREAKFHTIQNTSQNYNCAELRGVKFTDISEQCTAYIFRAEDGLLVIMSAP
jgi:hypothetical protein